MNVQWTHKTLSIGIAELSDWIVQGQGKGIHDLDSLTASKEGLRWHKLLRQRAAREHGDNASFEIPISGEYVYNGWTIRLEGRIDQWIRSSSGSRIQEIKTISDPLPQSPSALRSKYPAYFSQAGCYFFLISSLLDPSESLLVSLLFVERQTGITQEVVLENEDLHLWKQAVEQLTVYLTARAQSLSFWKRGPTLMLYPQWREEQQLVRNQWQQQEQSQRFFALEAPTGFGKTGLLWDWALHDLRTSKTDRVIYLTGRTSGQWQAAERLSHALADTLRDTDQGTPLYHLQRPRKEHCIHSTFYCVSGFCPFLKDLPPTDSLLQHSKALVEDGTVSLDTWLRTGLALQQCPYELSRQIAPIAPVWIADYNYILGKPSNRILKQDFDPSTTVLVIDEAHNLESRLLDHWSVEWSALEVLRIGEPLSHLDISSRFRELWEQWRRALDSLPGERLLSAKEIHWFEDLLFELVEQSTHEHWDWVILPPDIADAIWKLRETASLIAQENTAWEWIWWTPKPGVLQWAPMEIKSWLSKELSRFSRVYLASAFLPKELVLLPGAAPLRAEQPWREQAYQVALDLRIDTRYLKRKDGLQHIAQSFIDLCEQDSEPVVAFFPSYTYAESVLAYLEEMAPEVRVHLQPRGLDSEGQREFLETSLLTARGMFLILGSFASEGIDLLGGKVRTAMVVSPGLPEVNLLRQIRQEHWDKQSPGSGFLHCYVEPGLTKVQQALGRLVRNSGHRARVVLVCKRFAQPQYQEHLDPLFAAGRQIRTQTDWQTWLTDSHAANQGVSP